MTRDDGRSWPALARRAGLLVAALLLLAAMLAGIVVLSAILARHEGDLAGPAAAFYLAVFTALVLWPMAGTVILVRHGRAVSRRPDRDARRQAPWTLGVMGGVVAAPLGMIPAVLLVARFPGHGAGVLAACVGVAGALGAWFGAAFGRRVRDRDPEVANSSQDELPSG